MSSTALALSNDKLPKHIAGDANRGNEDVGRNVEIPRLKLLQKMSDELDKNSPNFEKDANEGDFFNTLTKEIYGPELYCINILFKNRTVVWKDRTKGQGGGKLGTYDTEALAAEAIEATGMPQLWIPTDTDEHLLIIKNKDTGALEASPVIYDMASTKKSVSRNWNTQIGMKPGDRFAGLWKLSSFSAVAKSGTPFSGMKVAFEGWTHEEDYKTAEDIFTKYSN
jgi:hypothetical protein|tara:strand:- start:578 stop:1249 length:672 start_codon:yes stop_codon:yes gene_type:complete